MKSAKTHALFAVLPIAVAFHGSHAFAQGIPDCSTLPNPIYMTGTTAVEPMVRHLGAKLRQLPVPQTLLWNSGLDGCGAVDGLAFPGTTTVFQSTFNYYDEPPAAQVDGGAPKITPLACNATLSKYADLVINDIFWTSCAEASSAPEFATLPADYKEFQGPVQGLVPIVQSSYYYYSDLMAEELLDIYACGRNANILTFTNNSDIFDYCFNSGIKALWDNSLGHPVSAFSAPINNASCPTALGMIALINSGSMSDDIAYTSTEVYDENRDAVRALKVRGLNQKLAYFPDTTLSDFDKINIREGRYTIQGALKLVAHVSTIDGGGDGQSMPDNPAAKRMIDWLQGNPVDSSLQLPFDIIDVYAHSGVVPQCAMKVTKDTDAPMFRPYQPDNPCSCYFQIQATGKAIIPGCTPCQDSSTCPDGKTCYFHGIPAQGYCE
jgi:hypothetical protein